MIIEKIFKMAHIRPNKAAIIHCGTPVSYLHFATAIATLRDHFRNEGVKRGDLVAICVYSQLDSWVILLGLRALGAHTVCMQSPRHALLADLEGITHFVTSAADPYRDDGGIAAQQGWRALTVTPDLLANPPADLEMPTDPVAEGDHIMLTSGTTGQYKAVRITPASAEEQALESLRNFKPNYVEDPDITEIAYVGSVGLWTAAGCGLPMTAWYCLSTIVCEQRADHAADFLTMPIETVMLTVPQLAEVLEALPPNLPRRDDLFIYIAGGALPWALAEKTLARITFRLANSLASTEAGGVGISFLQKPGDQFVYTIIPGCTVEIVDEEDRLVPKGQVGIMRVKLVPGRSEYLRRSGQMSDAIRDGYFYPGDLAAILPDGRLHMCGRADDVISIRGGDKVPTMLFEEPLQTELGLTGACLLSVVNPNQSREELHIVLEALGPVDEARLNAIVKKFPFTPADIHTVGKLPRNHMGKIDRRGLRAMLFD